MKIICDCGNESEFNTIDEETGEEQEIFDEDEGQYATVEGDFTFWKTYYTVGIKCDKCGKTIWIFT